MPAPRKDGRAYKTIVIDEGFHKTIAPRFEKAVGFSVNISEFAQKAMERELQRLEIQAGIRTEREAS